MDNRKKSESNDKILEATKERLKWYAKASEEEFDANEVEALVKLLNTLEPPKVKTEEEKEADLKRFRAYCNMRMAEGGLMDEETVKKATAKVYRKISDTTAHGKTEVLVEADTAKTTAKLKNKKSIAAFMRSHKLITAAAAVFLMVLIVGGSLGAVNAEKNGGFFYWLSKDDEGVTMLTSPEDMGASMVSETNYDSIENVPEQYLKYIVEKDELKGLQDYSFQSVRVSQNDSFCTVRQEFKTKQEEEYIVLGVKVYINETSLMREYYSSEQVEPLEKGEELEGKLLIKENSLQNEECEVLFYIGNKQYFVEGSCEAKILNEIAEEYRQFVMMFK